MKLIPVMDLMSGQVVHARRGERDQYRPIQSILCPSAAPEAILQALIENFQCDRSVR
jgi:phosphoribosylformimino-5-aminoimidazole carboxamide ribotide isomerase